MIGTSDKPPRARYIRTSPPSAWSAEPDVSVETAKADLAKLEARANTLEAELAAVRKRMDRLKIYVEVDEEYNGESSAEPEPEQASLVRLNGANHDSTVETSLPSLEDEPFIEACRGKSIADAAIALIRLAEHPLSEEEIVDQFRRGRVTTVSKNPTLNLRFSLMRKRKETGAVKLTDDKKHWDIGDGPYPEEDGSNRSAFFENRQRNDHAERSRQGLLAARARGAKHGRPFSITPEQREVAEGLLAEGERVGEIARLIGVSAVTFSRWRKKGLITDPKKNENPDTTSSE
jgi:hypothetical protein